MQSPALLLTITDATPNSRVHWVGTPVVSAPGSLGATASLQTAVASNDQLRVNFAASDAANIEIITISGLNISADANAAPGTIIATLTGPAAACVLPGTVTATGVLNPGGYPAGTTAFDIQLTGSRCPFEITNVANGGPGELDAPSAGKLVFASNVESLAISGDNGDVFGPAPTYSQPITTVLISTLVHSAGEVVSQTGVPNCSGSAGSPGSVSNNVGQTSTVTQKGNNPTTVNPGEQNQPAGTITLTENAPGVVPIGTLTFTLSPAGVKFSAPPVLTARAVPLATVTGLTATANNGACAAGTYFYKVTSLTAAGESVASAGAGATVVTAGSTVAVNWSAVAGATGYKIYGRPVVIGGVYGLIGTVGAVTTFSDTPALIVPGAVPPVVNGATLPAPTAPIVTPSTLGGTCPIGSRTYVVTALIGAGETTASPATSVTNTTATSSNAISWTAVAGATGYNIYLTAPGAFLVGTVASPTTTFTDTCAVAPAGAPPVTNTAVIGPPTVVTATPAGGPPGSLVAGTYFYEVTAIDAAGENLPSTPAGATITTGPGSITLTWTAVPGATGYRIYGRPPTAAGPYGLIGSVGAVTTFTDTGATPPGVAPPLVDTSAGTAIAAGAVCNLSFDRMSCTVSTTAISVGSPSTLVLSGPLNGAPCTSSSPPPCYGGILLDVDATVVARNCGRCDRHR